MLASVNKHNLEIFKHYQKFWSNQKELKMKIKISLFIKIVHVNIELSIYIKYQKKSFTEYLSKLGNLVRS